MAEKELPTEGILFKCTKRCGNYKFATSTVWKKVTKREDIACFAKKVKERKYDLRRILCPDCTPIQIEINSELQLGDIVPKSSFMGFDE
ncbi:MAG: hypothetical protein WC264_00805 [Candidatus Paceibacterota bacterium]|jgi:hypothetical protein